MDRTPDYEYLNSCRILSGLTNKAIAENVKSSEPTISRFFRGEMKDPGAGLFGAICDTIGASSDRALGVVKTIEEAMTDPAPSIPAVVNNVMETVSNIVDEKELAANLIMILKETPMPIDIDLYEFARQVAAVLPKLQEKECESCRSARAYESTIVFQTKLIAILGGSLALMIVFLMILLLKK